MAEEYRKEFIENRNRMMNEMGDAEKEQMMKDFQMPSMDDLMKMLDSMSGVTEEHKEKLREHLIKRAAFGNPFSDGQNPAEGVDMIPPATSFELITLAIYAIMLTSFIAVFGKLRLNKYLILFIGKSYLWCAYFLVFLTRRNAYLFLKRSNVENVE